MADNAEFNGDMETKKLGLWLRLITNSHVVEKQVRNLFRSEFGVTLPRFDLMSALYREQAGLTMGELSRRLLVSNGNVTGIVERLQKEGLVKRWVLPTDRRIYSVSLTPKGRAAFKELADCHRDWISEIFDGLQDDELTEMIKMMDRLRDILKNQKETQG